ncbi:biotin/lipoyl attachment domain-containing protein [Pseudonocardia dioxanivorans CB1190]|jgi:pyruvate/2-oxoglutarate dehydrogenase complex dihydrolipoamide acyltransferase (E2) component|uniref:Biotin/lipoyl attachment domain-containing protein n=1 Tax=Pseudonocardia dioxanivorans (strain ATCC 55486 / DSM 44775 / JCM 13855 / CB1190) TaxID=675635 RepID=F4CN86_PSEUX|nr:lipoyl domain-containing protein [Pseudonocardia dioxanivorans]AEA27110.1 biotin/lipoyl attachment domain-containing protein [Pseudonocardia dioxanivorans CB1190]
MKMTLKLVRVGMNMTEGTIVAWHKEPGDRFVPGDVLYTVETEKVSHDVEATADGTLVEILVPVDEDAEVGQGVCVVEVS